MTSEDLQKALQDIFRSQRHQWERTYREVDETEYKKLCLGVINELESRIMEVVDKQVSEKVLVDREKLIAFRNSKVKTIEWLKKHTMVDPLDTLRMTEEQAVIRTFIEKELLSGSVGKGESK